MNVWLLASSHSCHTRKFTFPAAPPRKTCHANHLSPDHWSTNKHRRISAAQQQSSRTQSAETSRERLSQRLLLRTHRAFYRLQKDRINQRDIDSSWRASPARRLKLVTGLSLQLIVCVCALVRWQRGTSAGTSIRASYMLSSGPDSVSLLQPDVSAADWGAGCSLIYGDVTQTDNRAPEDTLAKGHCRVSARRNASCLSLLRITLFFFSKPLLWY